MSVRESVKAPGWATLMTLLSDTAYHSFIGEVEALNTTTIRRLTRSSPHQPLATAPPCGVQDMKRIVVDVRDRRLSFDVVFGADIPNRRRRSTNQDQK